MWIYLFLLGKSSSNSRTPSASLRSSESSLYSSPQSPPIVKALTSPRHENFKLTEDKVVTALTDHLLDDFIVSHDRLDILETLGEGEIYHCF